MRVAICFLLAGVWTMPLAPQVDVFEATVGDLQRALVEQRATSVQLVDAYLARIAAYDQSGPALNAFIRLNPRAREQAAALDAERLEGRYRGPLHGIPIVLKDNFDTADMPTSGASVALAGSVPPDDAFQVARLREAGAIIIGKTNLHEMAMGITTVSALGGQTRNPYDPARNPGGSSGGTGAAVAASFAALGWGTDTCGSIRIPSAHHNLFGLRPTKGLSSIDGVIPLCHSQDVAGPLARSAMDLAIGLDATVGYDPADPATLAMRDREPIEFVRNLDPDALAGARIGVLTAAFGDQGEDAAAGRVVRAALERMQEAGAVLVDIEIPGLDSATNGSSLIPYEFKFDLMNYLAATPGAAVQSMDAILAGGLYHAELGARFRARNRVESLDTEEYRGALEKRAQVRALLGAAFAQHDLVAIAYPTLRRPPALMGEPQRGSSCQWSAASGFPALSMPAGFTADGLPIGMELLGPAFSDVALVSIAFAYDQAVEPRRAPAFTPRLVDGRPPAPWAQPIIQDINGVSVDAAVFYDRSTATLSWSVVLDAPPSVDVFALVVHADTSGTAGPIEIRLAGPGAEDVIGEVRLNHRQRLAIGRGQFVLRLYTNEVPEGGRGVPLFPERHTAN